MGIFLYWCVSISVPVYVIQSSCQNVVEMKRWKGMQGRMKPPLCDVCVCLFLGVSLASRAEVHIHSRSGNVWLLVPRGPGLLCKMSEHFMALAFHTIFDLAPINHH